MAILTNQYHLDRAQELLKKFNLQAKGYRAEDLITQRTSRYGKIVEKFFNSPGYQTRLAGEERWTRGLVDVPEYWYPQALTVANPERMDYILRSLGLEKAEKEIDREKLIKKLQQVPRRMPHPKEQEPTLDFGE